MSQRFFWNWGERVSSVDVSGRVSVVGTQAPADLGAVWGVGMAGPPGCRPFDL
jgi:hypothetical protein